MIRDIVNYIEKHGGRQNRPMKFYNKENSKEIEKSQKITKIVDFKIKRNLLKVVTTYQIDYSNSLQIITMNNTYNVNKKLSKLLIPTIKNALKNNPQLDSYNINTESNLSLIADLLSFQNVFVTNSNADEIFQLAKELQIPKLIDVITSFCTENKNHISVFHKIKNDIENYNDLMERLLSLSESNFNEVLDIFNNLIIESESKNQEPDFDKIIMMIIEASIARPNSNEILANFCKDFALNLSNSNKSERFCDRLFFFLFKNCYEFIFPTNYFFIHQLYKTNLINKDKLLNFIDQDKEELFCWFAPEFKEFNSEKYFKIINHFQQNMDSYQTQNIPLYNFMNNIIDFYNDNWKLHRECTSRGRNPNDIIEIIYSNDLNKFQDKVTDDEIEKIKLFQFDKIFFKGDRKKVPPAFPYDISFFERGGFFNDNPHKRKKISFFSDLKIIECAAYYDSIKIFKYIHRIHNIGKSLYFAIVSNSLEIFHICFQEYNNNNNNNNISVNACIEKMIQFHRLSLLDYFFNNINFKLFNQINTYFIFELCFAFNNLEALIFLIEFGLMLPPSAKGQTITNFFIYTIRNCNILTLKILTELYSNFYINDYILNESFLCGNTSIILFLLQVRSHQDQGDQNNIPPHCYNFYFSVIESENYHNLDIVYRHGLSEINETNDMGETPLTYAVAHGSVSIVSSLLQIEGIDINKPNFKGRTPLMVACEKGFENIVTVLLEREDINVSLKINSLTAEKIAIKQGYFKIKRLLTKDKNKIIKNVTNKNID